eukprot:SAG11_NODE_18189_length_497_cov_2.015075_1_plen_90_part_00
MEGKIRDTRRKVQCLIFYFMVLIFASYVLYCLGQYGYNRSNVDLIFNLVITENLMDYNMGTQFSTRNFVDLAMVPRYHYYWKSITKSNT